jgi:hypothetical protein
LQETYWGEFGVERCVPIRVPALAPIPNMAVMPDVLKSTASFVCPELAGRRDNEETTVVDASLPTARNVRSQRREVRPPARGRYAVCMHDGMRIKCAFCALWGCMLPSEDAVVP